MRSVCVFSGASFGQRPEYRHFAQQLGHLIAKQNLALVYGGACIGLMGTVADAALSAGGKVIGVIPESLLKKEVAHHGLTELHVVPSMHARKALMAERAEGFIALPGGFGTCEELIEVLTWAQLGLHGKPIGLLNIEGFYDPLLRFFEHCQTEQFIQPVHASLLLSHHEPETLLAMMAAYKSPAENELYAHLQERI